MREAIKSAATRRVGACPNSFRNSLRILRTQRVQPGPAQSAGPEFLIALGLQIRSKICPKIDQNFDVILVSFLVPLGPILASLLGPLGRPNRPKFGPRGPKIAPRRPKMASRPAKMTFFMPNRDFSKIVKILRKINDFGSPSRPKIALRWPQARSRSSRESRKSKSTRVQGHPKSTCTLGLSAFPAGPKICRPPLVLPRVRPA